jgi:hypothetical protein
MTARDWVAHEIARRERRDAEITAAIEKVEASPEFRALLIAAEKYSAAVLRLSFTGRPENYDEYDIYPAPATEEPEKEANAR